jgi:hypothetical protein
MEPRVFLGGKCLEERKEKEANVEGNTLALSCEPGLEARCM